ncbi:MAG: hypothetical protein JWL86_2145 [Rhizobium sp.]|nr:hypothetical protein [Rhizobium sp.]
MKITTIRFRRLRSHDRGYGHDAVEAEAEVQLGETPDEAFSALKAWVDAKLTEEREIGRINGDLQSLRQQLEHETRDRDRLKKEAEEWRAIARSNADFLELARKAGRDDLIALIDDGIPF